MGIRFRSPIYFVKSTRPAEAERVEDKGLVKKVVDPTDVSGQSKDAPIPVLYPAQLIRSSVSNGPTTYRMIITDHPNAEYKGKEIPINEKNLDAIRVGEYSGPNGDIFSYDVQKFDALIDRAKSKAKRPKTSKPFSASSVKEAKESPQPSS